MTPLGKRSHNTFVQQQDPVSAPSLQDSLRGIGWLGKDEEADKFYQSLKWFIDGLSVSETQYIVRKGSNLDYFSTARNVRALSLGDRRKLLVDKWSAIISRPQRTFKDVISLSVYRTIIHNDLASFEVFSFMMGKVLDSLINFKFLIPWNEELLHRLDRYEFKMCDLQSPPLHTYIKIGRLSLVQRLVESGVSIDERDDNGNTVLHAAVARGLTELQAVLLKRGANPAAQNKAGLRAEEEDHVKHLTKLRELGWLGSPHNLTEFLVALKTILEDLFEKEVVPQELCVRNHQQIDLYETVKKIQNNNPSESFFKKREILIYFDDHIHLEVLLFLFGVKWRPFGENNTLTTYSLLRGGCKAIKLLNQYQMPFSIEDVNFAFKHQRWVEGDLLLTIGQFDLIGQERALQWIMYGLQNRAYSPLVLLQRKDVNPNQEFVAPPLTQASTLLINAYHLNCLQSPLMNRCDVNQISNGTCLLNEAAKLQRFSKVLFEWILDHGLKIDINCVLPGEEPLIFKCVRPNSGYSPEAVIPLLERGAKHTYTNSEGEVLNVYELMPADLKDQIQKERHRVD